MIKLIYNLIIIKLFSIKKLIDKIKQSSVANRIKKLEERILVLEQERQLRFNNLFKERMKTIKSSYTPGKLLSPRDPEYTGSNGWVLDRIYEKNKEEIENHIRKSDPSTFPGKFNL